MTQGFVNPYTYATSAPTVTTYTSGSGTYTTPAGVKYIQVLMCGGGGGGSGSGTGSPGAGSAGGNTTFGSSFLTANGGNGASADASLGNSGGTGGTATIGSGAIGLAMQGGAGGSGGLSGVSGTASAGGTGGVSFFGGAGLGPKATIAGSAAITNSGSGGGGAGGTGPGVAGGGGGAGGYIHATISSPGATYAYAVGASGSGGSAGTSGAAGGAGGSGVIYVYEYYEVLGIPTSLTLPLSVSNGGTGTSVAPSTFYVNTANTNIIALSLVKFSNVLNDSVNAYSTSTGLYTIPRTGWYIVNSNIKTNNYNYGGGAIIQIDIRQNSNVIAQQIITPTAYNSTSCALNAGTTYYFTAGDTVSVYAFSNLAGASTTLDNSITNFLSINFLHS